MNPVMIELGRYDVQWYSVFFLISCVLSFLILDKYIFEREGVPKHVLYSTAAYVVVAMFVFGRLFHCLFYEPEYYLEHPWHMIIPWRGRLGNGAVFVGYRGLSGHGSAIGIVIALIINALRTKTPILWLLDRIAIFGPLIGFFVRMGNLFNSEILGKITNVPWAFIFVRKDHIPRHPIQLYEAITYIIIFAICFRYYYKRGKDARPGAILGLVMILMYVSRFLLEFLKARQSLIESTIALNMGHWLSIPFIAVGLFLFFRTRPFSTKRTT
jgi:prolipoprotein diacylglyceryl transferase